MRGRRSLFVAALAVALTGCGGADPEAERLRESTARHEAEQAAIAAREQTKAAQEAAEEAGLAQETTATASPPPETPTPAAAPPGGRALLSEADRASFAQLAANLPGGAAGIAVASTGLGTTASSAGSLTSGVAWSTAKVPVAMAAIRAGAGRSADLTAAITASDNAAAERLFAALGGGATAAAAATAQVRAAGDSATTIQGERLRSGYTPFGQTSWSLIGQAHFAAGLACTAPGREALALMRRTIAAQRWGLGTVGSSPALKGGWGPGRSPGAADGWLDRQFGVVQIGGRPVAIAIAVAAPDHASGTQALTRIASWAETHIDGRAATATARC
jgi:hypothetical protein